MSCLSQGFIDNKNSKGEIGSPCLLPLVILNGAEQILPVTTMSEGLAYRMLIILMKLPPYVLRQTRDMTVLVYQELFLHRKI